LGRRCKAREWIIGLGEAVVLAVFFRVAASHTHNWLVWVLAFLMSCAVGAYVGVPIGRAAGSVYSIKTKWLRGLLLVAVFVAYFAMSVTNVIGVEFSQILDQITKAGSH
jgi:hypothetical protein